jgi:mono/diheme cytochrome c family protein
MKTLVAVSVLAFAVALGVGFKLASGADQVFDGQYIYANSCSTCHGEAGQGVMLFAPPLKGDGFITMGDDKAITDVIHWGRKYQAKMYKDYMGMPRFQFIRAGEMDDLISFLKGGLQQGSVVPAEE